MRIFGWISGLFKRNQSAQPQDFFTPSKIKEQYKQLSKNELIRIILFFVNVCQDPTIKKIIDKKIQQAKDGQQPS